MIELRAGPLACECWRISSSMHSHTRESPSCARWISRTTRSQAREPFAKGFRSHSMKGNPGPLLTCVVALFLSGCARQSASSDRAQPDPIAVRIATPKHVRVPAEVVVSGTVETPSAPTTVGFLVSGKVIRVGPREGDFVKPGEVLAVIDPADYQFAVEGAIAQTALARAQNEKASVSARPEVVEQARASLSETENEYQS